MITFFTMCRPFEGEFDKLQRVAIESWLGAVPGCQVMLMAGKEEQTRQVAQELGVQYCHKIERNEHGTPLVNSAFVAAEQYAVYDLLCEVSSDIVFGADFNDALDAILQVNRPFVVGQRWDVEQVSKGDAEYRLHDPAGIDYFVYRKETLGEIPPFAVGRTAYDNWLVWAAIERWGLTCIDATQAITAIHINHGYKADGWVNGKSDMLQSEERERNHALARETGCTSWYNVHSAPWILERGMVKRRA